MNSALYFGTVRHRRFEPRPHRFVNPLYMAYVDLDEIDTISGGVFGRSLLWSTRRPAPAWLRRRDYFGDASRPWAEVVREAVEERTGTAPTGAVRLLTQPRTLGLRMNPVSFYYCFDSGPNETLAAVVAEVTNTPWDERHLYVVDRQTGQKSWDASFDKDFHVSPFLPMDIKYRWRLTPPDRRLFFHMEDFREDRKLFDATLSLRRREITPRELRLALVQHPAMTWRILLWIYWHAAHLKLKGIPFLPHPKLTARSTKSAAAIPP